MKKTLFLLTLTAFCVALIYPPHSFAQTFIDGQMPDTFLAEHTEWVNSVAFSPDGTTLASGSGDATIKLWDVATGTLKATLEGHEDGVNSVAFSPDGTTLASGSEDIKLWDVATGTLKATLEGHTGTVYSVAFSPDGNTLASGSEDIKLWDVATGTLKATLAAGTVYSVAFSPDGNTLASGEWNTVKLWDIATSKLKSRLKNTRESRMARYAAITDVGGPGEKRVRFEIDSVAFSPDGKTLASGGNEYIYLKVGSLDEEDPARVEALLEFQINNYDNLPLRVTPRDRDERHGYLNLSTGRGTIDLWDVASGALKATLDALEGHMSFVYSVAFSPDGRTLASGDTDGLVRLWDITRQPKAPKATLSIHGSGVGSVVFSPDGTRLASGSANGTVRLWMALLPVNNDGVVNIADLVEVAQNFGQVGKNNADINGDGIVNVVDLILVAVALGEGAAAPTAHAAVLSMLTAEEVEQWLIEAKQLQTDDPIYLRGIRVLEQLRAALTPAETALLANYPNPFNPETWMPYQLAKSADVTLTIYSADGKVIRTLILGDIPAGRYISRSRAAYWDGRNALGEPVASGIYFYTLTAGDFTATRRMLILK